MFLLKFLIKLSSRKKSFKEFQKINSPINSISLIFLLKCRTQRSTKVNFSLSFAKTIKMYWLMILVAFMENRAVVVDKPIRMTMSLHAL